MLIAGLSTLVIFSGVSGEVMPHLIDLPLVDYYARAISSGNQEPQKALAMLELLLVPDGTQVVADYSNLPAYARPSFKRGVERGFDMWRMALGDEFPFRLVDRATQPNPVGLRFVSIMPDSAPDHKGEIKTTRKIQWNKSLHYSQFVASISIAKFSVGQNLMTERDITHITAHELGHGLGLGDVDNLEHIMGPVALGNAYAHINPDEVDAVMSFRRLVHSQISRIESRN